VSEGAPGRIHVDLPAAFIPEEIRALRIPDLVTVRSRSAVAPLDDPRGAVHRTLTDLLARTQSGFAGKRVAVALGSRGLGRYPDLVAGALNALRAAGAEPFLMPAMGSHGGGTPEGQTRVLREYGLLPDGLPLEASDETVQIGTLEDGTGLHASTVAGGADAIVVLNRIKSHTGFRGPVESGLTKMLVIGLGKRPGAASMHAKGYVGFADRLEAARERLLAHSPPVLGVAVVEDAEGNPAHVEALAGADWADREPELLKEAKRLMPRLPFDKLDLLVVERAGKDVSGLGMDPNVTGRFALGEPQAPNPTRVALLSLTPASEGNANGMGHADVVPRSFVDAIDPVPTWTNVITSTSLGSARLPVVTPDARTCIQVALATCGVTPEKARIAWIRDTADLAAFHVSEAALRESTASLEVVIPSRAVDLASFD